MRVGEASHCAYKSDEGDSRFAGVVGNSGVELRGHRLQSRINDKAEQVSAVAHPLVQRRRTNAHAVGDSLHGERRWTTRLEEHGRCCDDLSQRGAVWCGHASSTGIRRPRLLTVAIIARYRSLRPSRTKDSPWNWHPDFTA